MIITEEKYNEELTRYVLPFIRLNFEDGYMKSADGTRIHYGYVTTPVAKAAIVISHGFTECMPKYYEMIYYFAKAGYSVYMVEHRGHGFSDRSVSDISMVTVNSFDDYVSDLDMFIREIVMKREGRRPLYLYGHSMGGAIAALYLEKHPEVFTKAVLSSPMIEMLYGNFSHFAVEAILFVASVLNWNDKYLPSQTPYTDEYYFESSCCLSKARYDYIYKCKVEEERYRTNGATYRWCRAGRKASKYIKKHAQEIKIPVLLCQAGKDYLVSNAAEDEFIAKLPQGIKKVYPDSKHEIFNADDDTLEKFYSDILDFWA